MSANPRCGACGQEATGFATETVNGVTTRYCHGDDDESPTCYERRNWTDYSSSSTMTFYLDTAGTNAWKNIIRQIRKDRA